MDLPLAFQLQVDNNMSEGDVPANLIPTDEEASAMLEMEKSMDSIILNAATANLDKAIDLSDLDTNSADPDTNKLESSVDKSLEDLDAALADL